MASAREALPAVRVRTRAEWRAWLAAHHAQGGAIQLVFPKQAAAAFRDLTYDALVEEALCWGWIDGTARRVDDDWTSLRLSPRRARSNWSPTNRARVARLLDEGRIAPPGLAAIERAKADGTWGADA